NHRAILRTRNLAAQEGDMRFRDVRNQTLSIFTDRLAAKVAEHQAAGKVAAEITPYAAAAAVVAMMERMAAYHFDLEERGVGRDGLVRQHAGGVDCGARDLSPDEHVGQEMLHRLERAHRAPELLALGGVGDREITAGARAAEEERRGQRGTATAPPRHHLGA